MTKNEDIIALIVLGDLILNSYFWREEVLCYWDVLGRSNISVSVSLEEVGFRAVSALEYIDDPKEISRRLMVRELMK